MNPTRRRMALAAAIAAATVLVSATPRLLLAAGVLPDAAQPFVWSDVRQTYLDHLSGGRLPYRDAFFDYPPGIGYLAGALALIAPDVVAYVALWTVLVAASAAVVGAELARAAGLRRALAFWSLSPQLLLYSGANFDVLPTALFVGAILLARRGSHRAAMATLAVGAVAKIFPAVAAPPLALRVLRSAGPRAAVTALGVFVVVVAVLWSPSLGGVAPSTVSTLVQAQRTNFDSLWGVTLAALNAGGVSGAVQIVGIASAAGMLLTYLMGSRRGGTDPARAGLLALLALLLWTRLYSPQYSLWIVPFFALVPLPWPAFAVLSLGDAIVFATVYPLTLTHPPLAGDTALYLYAGLVAGIALRHAALAATWIASWRGTRAG